MNSKAFHILLFILFGVIAYGQKDTLFLSIDDVIRGVKGENLQIKRMASELEFAEAQYTKSKEWWLPELFVGTKFHNLTGSAMNTDGQIFSNLDRQSRWYGGELSVNWDIGQGISSAKIQKLETQRKLHTNKAMINEEIISALRSYYDLMIAQSEISLYQQLISSKTELIGQLEIQVEAELRLESELLLAKSNIQRLKLELLNIQDKYLKAGAQLLRSLNITSLKRFIGDANSFEILELVDLDNINSNRASTHPWIKAQELRISSAELTKKSVQHKLIIPELGLRYSAGPFGDTYTNTENTYGIQAYIGWNIPLGQIMYNGDGKMADARLKSEMFQFQELENSLSIEVDRLADQLLRIRSHIELTEEVGEYAQKALEQNLTRQEAGFGSGYEVLQAQEEFLKARILYFETIANYNLMQYKLFVALGNDL